MTDRPIPRTPGRPLPGTERAGRPTQPGSTVPRPAPGSPPRDPAGHPARTRHPGAGGPPSPSEASGPASASGQPGRPNVKLAAVIAEAGFSHAGLARRVNQLGVEHGLDLRYDKTSVTRWLRGQQPRGTTPALIAEVFTQRLGRRLSTQDLGLDAAAPVYAGLEYAATPGEAVDIVSGLWRKDTGSPVELRKIAFTPAGLVVPSRDWLIGRPDERVAREEDPEAGHEAGHGTGAEGVPGTGPGRAPGGTRPGPVPLVGRFRPGAAGAGGGLLPARAGRVPAQTRGGPRMPPAAAAPVVYGRVGGGEVAAVQAVGDLFRSLDHAYGGGHARLALVRYLEHEAEPMLRGGYGEALGRRLFGTVADLTRLAGWTSYDIGAHGLAQRYFVQALRLAQAAGDRVFGGYVLVTMSRQAVYLGHGREAVQLARVAQQGVGTGAPPVVQALLHAAEARGHGLLAEGRACAAALARAERALGPRGAGTRCRPGRASSTRRSSPTSSGTASGTSSSTGRRRSTPSGRSSCGRQRTCAAGCSAGRCWRARGWGWGRWRPPARTRGRRTRGRRR